MKHYNDKMPWPKGKRIQVVKLGPRAFWTNYPHGNIEESAQGLIGTLKEKQIIRVENDFTYLKSNGQESYTHKAGSLAFNLNDFYYIDLDDPDENY